MAHENSSDRPSEEDERVILTGPVPNLDGGIMHLADSAMEEFDDEDRGRPAITIVSGVVTGLIAIGFIIGSLPLGLGALARPGSGAWPLGVAVAVLAGSVFMVVRAGKLPLPERFTKHVLTVSMTAVAVAGWAVLLPYVGFEIPSLLLAFAWIKFLGKRGWLYSTVAAVTTVTALYVLFVVALRVDLPRLLAF